MINFVFWRLKRHFIRFFPGCSDFASMSVNKNFTKHSIQCINRKSHQITLFETWVLCPGAFCYDIGEIWSCRVMNGFQAGIVNSSCHRIAEIRWWKLIANEQTTDWRMWKSQGLPAETIHQQEECWSGEKSWKRRKLFLLETSRNNIVHKYWRMSTFSQFHIFELQ